MLPFHSDIVMTGVLPADCVESNTPLCLDPHGGAASLRISSCFRPVFSTDHPAGTAIAFLFAEDTTAVGLSVQAERFRDPDPFRPAFTKIPIEKRNTIFHGHLLADTPDEIVLLKAAVKESGRKGVETAVFSDLRRLNESQAVAVPATILLTECDLPQEPLQGVVISPYDWKPRLTGIGFYRIETLLVFQIGMDIRIEKVAAYLMTLLSEHPQRIDGTGSTADMQQYLQSQFTNQILCEGSSFTPPALKKTPPGLPRSIFC